MMVCIKVWGGGGGGVHSSTSRINHRSAGWHIPGLLGGPLSLVVGQVGELAGSQGALTGSKCYGAVRAGLSFWGLKNSISAFHCDHF